MNIKHAVLCVNCGQEVYDFTIDRVCPKCCSSIGINISVVLDRAEKEVRIEKGNRRVSNQEMASGIQANPYYRCDGKA